jgi:hypothetical protein
MSALIAPLAVATPAGDLNLTPTSIKLKVYKFAVSTSGLCTNLITVVDNGSTPTEVDFTSAPNLGSGSLGDGTYPCVVVEMSDQLKFTPPNSASGACLAAQEETLDVCRSGGSNSTLVNGTVTSCTNGDDRVAMYLSTFSASTNSADSFNAPTSNGDATRGITLGAALTVSGSVTGRFIANPTGQVCDDTNDTGSDCEGAGANASCEMGPPSFSFTTI